jgi:double-stranded uracil-DNA glycosylase
MPGAESLRQQRYYAFGPNHFWRVMFGLYGLEVPDEYEKRVSFLHEKHIAAWDVLESCERPGSADADIKEPKPNDIPGLLAAHPGIAYICLNGNGATKLFNRLVLPNLPRQVQIATFPSTSPAYAIPFQNKLDGWKMLLEFLS